MVMFIEGTELMETSDIGKVLIATKVFNMGDIVVQESPLLIYIADDNAQEEDNAIDFILSFLDLDELHQNLVLSMYHPPLDMNIKRVKDHRNLSDFLYSNLPTDNEFINKSNRPIDSDLICKLLLIADTNSHTYYCNNNVGKPFSALFHYASLVEHSCDPNVAYNSCSGYLKYTAIKKSK